MEYTPNTLMTFIDILGFKKMVEHRPLSELKELIEHFMESDDSGSYHQMSEIHTKFISDSLIVWMELEHPKDLTSYFIYIGSLVARIHKHGKMFVRGCIAYGNHYSNETIWISPVFIDAYKGEQEKADVPRIILLDEAITAISNITPDFLHGLWLEQDEDGITYVNYMNMISGAYVPEGDHIVAYMNHSKLAPSLMEHKLSIDDSLEKYPQHANKYRWLAKFHNNYVENHIRLPNRGSYLIEYPRRFSYMDIPRIFTITESAHRIHNPITPEKLATLGAELRLEPGTRLLDLGSGSGEMLCSWARDHGITGTGIDMSPLFTQQAQLRAVELGVADQVTFIHNDAVGYIADEKVGLAACVGATWIGGGVSGTIELLKRSLSTNGIILIGEPFWRQLPPTEEVAKGCLAHALSDFLTLPELIASFGNLGYDLVEMVLADQDGWDRYEAAKWLTMRRWLEANSNDEFAKEVRAQLTTEPVRYATYTREYLGWGVFALMPL